MDHSDDQGERITRTKAQRFFMAGHVLNSMILMLSKLEKGRIELGESGGSSFRAKIMSVVVKRIDFGI